MAGRELRARGGTAARGLLGVDHPERSGRWGGFYPKMPPKVEVITMPRTTQQMMIMIFFCTGRHREASERAEAGGWEAEPPPGRALRGGGLLGSGLWSGLRVGESGGLDERESDGLEHVWVGF